MSDHVTRTVEADNELSGQLSEDWWELFQFPTSLEELGEQSLQSVPSSHHDSFVGVTHYTTLPNEAPMLEHEMHFPEPQPSLHDFHLTNNPFEMSEPKSLPMDETDILLASMGNSAWLQISTDRLEEIRGLPFHISGPTSNARSVEPEQSDPTTEPINASRGDLTPNTSAQDGQTQYMIHNFGFATENMFSQDSEWHPTNFNNSFLRPFDSSHSDFRTSRSSDVILTPSGESSLAKDDQVLSKEQIYIESDPAMPQQPNDAFEKPTKQNTDTVAGVEEKLRSRKRRYEPEELYKVNSVRQSSACIRCQVMKEACSEDCDTGPCERCLRLESKMRIWRVPCYRSQLSSAEFFRTVSLTFPYDSRSTKLWDGRGHHIVEMFYAPSFAYDSKRLPTMALKCRKFRPGKEDILTKSYPTPEGPRVLTLPPITLVSLPSARKIIESFLNENLEFFVDELKVGVIGSLFSSTFDEAWRLSKNSTMISQALKIAVLTRLGSKSFGVRGEEDLGIKTDEHPLSPYRGRKPVPVMVDREMFKIMLQFMSSKRKPVLSELKRKIMKRDRSLWFEIFLTIFILMSNLEFSYHHQVRKLKRHQAAALPGEIVVAKPTLIMLDKWQSSAENLIAHFSVICRGEHPFHLDWSTGENKAAAGLDEMSAQYMVALTNKLPSIEWPTYEQMDLDMARLQPLFWVSKIFQPK